MGNGGLLASVAEVVKLVQLLWKSVQEHLRNLKTDLSYDTAVLTGHTTSGFSSLLQRPSHTHAD